MYNTLFFFKNSVNVFNGEWEQKIIGKTEKDMTFNLNNRKKITYKNDLEICEIMIKDLLFMSLEYQDRKKTSWTHNSSKTLEGVAGYFQSLVKDVHWQI